ncbi:hypothetical protein [Streptomyces sp. SID10815]|uniref:hypothetical protein n=1 Tax=Streptomyces sp. SID10815 TaxID=2706027 RepID=UPI001943115B|nr:hypothetical protein [Streptomyces sp. SID10815]
MTEVTAATAGLTPFLVPLASATLLVTAGTWVLVRRDRRLRARTLRGGPPGGED